MSEENYERFRIPEVFEREFLRPYLEAIFALAVQTGELHDATVDDVNFDPVTHDMHASVTVVPVRAAEHMQVHFLMDN